MAPIAPDVTPHSLPSLPRPESVGGMLAAAVERVHVHFGPVTVFELPSSRRNRTLADLSRAPPCALVSNATGAEKTLVGETL